jgi:hypothetical protein
MRWVEVGHATRLCSTTDEEINDRLVHLGSHKVK